MICRKSVGGVVSETFAEMGGEVEGRVYVYSSSCPQRFESTDIDHGIALEVCLVSCCHGLSGDVPLSCVELRLSSDRVCGREIQVHVLSCVGGLCILSQRHQR
jgi:hypothetical protein